jgi:TPR repeat protein
MHYKGQGVLQNYKKASKWIRLAADQGLAVAQTNLGLMYIKGQGVPQDHREAFKLFELAAEQGGSSAQYRLGMMYEHGRGVLQDNVSAYMWYSLGASQGHKIAGEHRNIIEKKMSPSHIEIAQQLAREWLVKHRG